MDIRKLIDSINSDVSSFSYFDSKVYTDEPIIRTASQIDNYLPEQYKKMKKIGSDNLSVKKTNAQIFYEQAKVMEEFIDDYAGYTEFNCYSPTYSSMNDKQLRVYFTWRSGVRNGVAQETSLSYVYLYLYELLMLIGTNGPESAFKLIRNFRNAYRHIDTRIDAYVNIWLKDMIIYYNLDPSLLNELYDDSVERAMLVVISNKYNEAELLSSLRILSSYNFEGSSFCKKNMQEYAEVCFSVFKKLFEFYESKRKGSLTEKFFGRIAACNYHMFSSAVFYENSVPNEYVYTINPIHKYFCKNGIWTCERYYGNLKNNKEIGNILKLIDYFMREKVSYKGLKNIDEISCSDKKLIIKIINAYYEEKEKSKIQVVSVNTGLLNAIRSNAEIIKGKLIVEEEEEFDEITVQVDDTQGLSKIEKQFLFLIINNLDMTEFLKTNNLIPSVLIDRINEKLLDEFCDSVIYYDGDTPKIYEDYNDDIKGMIL